MLLTELIYWTNFKIIILTLLITLWIKKFSQFFRLDFFVIVHRFSFPMQLTSALQYFMWGWSVFEPKLTRLYLLVQGLKIRFTEFFPTLQSRSLTMNEHVFCDPPIARLNTHVLKDTLKDNFWDDFFPCFQNPLYNSTMESNIGFWNSKNKISQSKLNASLILKW